MSKATHEQQILDPELVIKLQEQSERLVQSVRAGDYSHAMALISELADVRDQGLYKEVGRLTRSLHEAMRNFQIDPRNTEQKEALSKMTDASDRLEYVVRMTSQAANRTMDLVEESMPVAQNLKDEAAHLHHQWQRLRSREMAPAEFRELHSRMDTFLSALSTDTDRLYGNFSEILLAQDYQDLTGQVIQKVITLVREVEDNLLSLVVMAGHVDQLTGTVHDIADVQTSAEQGVGPQMRPQERQDVVSGQDDVDDLLSSLGF